MRIGICVPARGQIEISTSFDLSALVNYTAKTTKHDINLYTSTGTLIFDQRNALVDSVINERCDYLMFIDADMRFPKDALIRLLSSCPMGSYLAKIFTFALKQKTQD